MKKIVFLSIFYFAELFSSSTGYKCKENYNEMDILKRLIIDKLDLDSYLCFCGNANMTASYTKQKVESEKGNSQLSFQGNVNLRYLGSSNDFGYGFELNAKTNSGIIKAGNAVLDRSYIFLEIDKIGELRIGYTETSANRFSISGSDVLVGYSGFGSGNMGGFYNPSSGSIMETKNPSDDNNAAKIAWCSPIYKGFCLGVSYTIDSRDTNLLKSKRSRSDFSKDGRGFNSYSDKNWDFFRASVYSQNAITVGMSYEYGSDKDFCIKVAASGWLADGCSEKSEFGVKNVRAYQLGGKIGYKKLKISLGFLDNGKSLIVHRNDVGGIAVNSMERFEKIYSVGASYKINEKLEISAGYFTSSVLFSSKDNEKSTSNITTIALEYRFSDHLSAYLEYDNVNTKAGKVAMERAKESGLPSVGKNRANIVMFGAKIDF